MRKTKACTGDALAGRDGKSGVRREVGGMRVLRRAALAQDDGLKLAGFLRFACHSERSTAGTESKNPLL